MKTEATGQDRKITTSHPIAVNIDAAQTVEPVSKYEFGPLIYDDRKFYCPITSAEPAPLARAAERRPHAHAASQVASRRSRRKVVMDRDQPFVGDQSPRIQLDPSTQHGIRESGLALVKGKKYVGRIWLRGTPGVKVTVG